MSIYKHIEKNVTADHFVLSRMSVDYNINKDNTSVSIFDLYFFEQPAFAVLFFIWSGLLISVFQARFFPNKFISVQTNITIVFLRVLCVFLALWLFIVLAWKHTFTVYFFIFVFSCLYIKRKETLVKAGFFIITEFLKFVSLFFISSCANFIIATWPSKEIKYSLVVKDKSTEDYIPLFDALSSLALLLFLPVLISILFRWDTATYRNTISLKYIVLTCVCVYIAVIFTYTLEWIDWK